MQDLALELAQTLQIFPRIKYIAHRNAAISRSEIGLLGCVYRAETKGKPYLTPSGIGKRLGISRPAVTAVINHALDEEFITRNIDMVDKRRVQIALTDKGRAQFEQIWQQVVGTVDKLLEKLGEQDGRELVRLLQNSLEVLRDPEFA